MGQTWQGFAEAVEELGFEAVCGVRFNKSGLFDYAFDRYRGWFAVFRSGDHRSGWRHRGEICQTPEVLNGCGQQELVPCPGQTLQSQACEA